MKITIEAESLTDERLLPILKAASEMGQLVRVVCEVEPRAVEQESLLFVDWSIAPAWAKYHAIDESGAGYFYEARPLASTDVAGPSCGEWVLPYSDCRIDLGQHYALCNFWRDSLTTRPAVPCSRSES